MTPPPDDPPQTVLDLPFGPGEDDPRAVGPELLSPDAAADLDRALQNIPATLPGRCRSRDHERGMTTMARRRSRAPWLPSAWLPPGGEVRQGRWT